MTVDATQAVPEGRDIGDDPVLLAVIQGALSNIQAEMTATLERTGRSNVATIARDYSNAIFDSKCELILQGQDIPVHLGSLIIGMKRVAEYFAGDIHPGDVYYHNDPETGGSHIPDMCAYKPIFIDGELAFWGVSKLHVIDAGGPVPSSYNIEATELYAEGLRIPPVKLIERGVERKDVLQLILANVRTSDNQAGDIRAQFGAIGVADKRLTELCEKYDVATVHAAGERLKELADAQMREVIRSTPDGTTVGSAYVEDAGHGHGEKYVKATVTVAGDELSIVLDSPPQIPFYINSYEANTVSAVYLGLTMWAQLPPPYNEGLYRGVKVDCGTKGTLVNAEVPAPCVNSTSCPAESISDAVRKALTGAAPRRPMAEWGRTFGVNVAGVDPRDDRYFISYLLGSLISGAGAIDGLMDGWHMIGPADVLGALTCGDTEILELLYPVILHEYSIREDSAGIGRWRGGCGNLMTIEPLAEMDVVAWGQGMQYPSEGYDSPEEVFPERKVAGGTITWADGSQEIVTGNRMFKLRPGELYTSRNPGGGGCGDPLEREPERVAEDVRNKRVSVEAARAEYGVAIDPESLEPDADETESLRAELRRSRTADNGSAAEGRA